MAGERLEILIIEDSALFRRHFTRIPEELYELAGEAPGQAGVRRAEALPPDCIVPDLNLPGLNGLRFLEGLRRGGNACAVVAAMDFGKEQAAVSSPRAGATGSLVNGSLAPEAFPHSIDRAIGKQRLVCRFEQRRGGILHLQGGRIWPGEPPRAGGDRRSSCLQNYEGTRSSSAGRPEGRRSLSLHP